MRSPAQRVILLTLLVAWVLGHTAVFGDEPQRAKETPLERIRRTLDQPITLDFSGQSVQEALQHVRDKAGIEVNLDQVALAFMGVNINGDQPVTLKSNGGKLGIALRKMLAAHQLTYVIYEESLLITSSELAATRQMKQRISFAVHDLPLKKALRDLARNYAFNLVIDPKVARDADRAVSLTLDGASLETSVRLLAELAELKAVRMDNVLFITTEGRADKIRKEEKDAAPNPLDERNPRPEAAAGIGGVIGGIVAGAGAIQPLPPTVDDGPPDEPPSTPEAAPAKKEAAKQDKTPAP